MHPSSIFPLTALVVLCTALPAPDTHTVHERLKHSTSWAKGDRIAPDASLPMRIGLQQQNLDQGSEFVLDVSDPKSPNYGKHWTSEQVVNEFSPSNETIESVRRWLEESGISRQRITLTDNKGWLAFNATTREAEDLLHTKFYSYKHVSHGSTTVACQAYHVPKDIQHHIDFVKPGVLLAPIARRRSFRQVSRSITAPTNGDPVRNDFSNCTTMTPDCIAAAYRLPKGSRADPSNTIGIYEDLQPYSQQDLDLFFEKYSPEIPAGTHPILASLEGAPRTPSRYGGEEAHLDLMYAYPIVWPQQITFYIEDSLRTPHETGFNTFFDAIDGSYCSYDFNGQTGKGSTANGGRVQCGIFKPTNVISVSYGGSELEIPQKAMHRQCNEMMKLGLQGHTILFSSGDEGVATRSFVGEMCYGKEGTVFAPGWPANCDHVTSVGGTALMPGKVVTDPNCESATTTFGSSGGFSNYYSRPIWQEEAVSKYLQEHDPQYSSYSIDQSQSSNITFKNVGDLGGIYNRAGRGIPDISGIGQGGIIFVNNKTMRADGTSLSAPVVGAIINRINEERLAVGKSIVGFINPALYANPSMLNDVKSGNNPGCGTKGFTAVEG